MADEFQINIKYKNTEIELQDIMNELYLEYLKDNVERIDKESYK